MKKIVWGRHLIAGISRSGAPEIIANGAAEIANGKIVRVGPVEELVRDSPNAEVIGSNNDVVFPGFVNAHHHQGITPFQLGSPDLPLELWINRRTGGKAVPLYLDTMYSAFEMVRSGVTTVQHLQGRLLGPVENIYADSNEILRAYDDIGMRVSYSFGVRDQNRLVYEDDEIFASRLPQALKPKATAHVKKQAIRLEDNFELFGTLRQDAKGHKTRAIQMAPVNLQWCSDRALELVGQCSADANVPMHMHLLETRYQEYYARQRTRRGSIVQFLKERDLLNERLTLGHGVWLNEAGLDQIAEAGVHICHNCSSNMRLRSGAAPVLAMRRRNIGVAMGIDEAGINDDRDMLQEMRLVLHSNRTPGMGAAGVLTCCEVFQMATEGGGDTTPFKGKIGRIEAGRSADLALVDWSKVSGPYLEADVPIVDALVHRAKSGAVHTVVIEGRTVLSGGTFVNVDEVQTIRELRDRLSGPLAPQELELRKMAIELLPFIEAFYETFPKPTIPDGERGRAFLPWK